MGYLKFASANRRILSYGFVVAFFSSFGQTFFVSVFNHDFKELFNLNDFDIGIVYGSATLIGALMMVPLGRRLDVSDLRRFTIGISLFLILACFLTASVNSIVLLWLAYFSLRLGGQGLFGSTSSITMARYFDENRGKAIVIAALAFPLAKALLPSLAVELNDRYGWQHTWLLIAICVSISAIPLLLWLLKGHSQRHRQWVVSLNAQQSQSADQARDMTRGEVLRNLTFYRVLPILLAPPFLGTAMFFHIEAIGASKGWSLEWITLCYAGLSTSWIVMLLVGGSMVDRWSARRLLMIFIAPFGIALLVVSFLSHPAALFVAMLLVGFTFGLNRPVAGAIWAELYGVKNLGAIKGVTGALMQMSTALGPVVLGWLLTFGTGVEGAALLGAGSIAIALLLVVKPVRPAWQ